MRKKVLRGVVGSGVRELLRETCKSYGVEILKGHVSKDHVHLSVSVSKLARYHGKGSYKLMRENKHVSRLFWGRGYFVATSDNITDEVIMECIKNQDNSENEDGEFMVVE